MSTPAATVAAVLSMGRRELNEVEAYVLAAALGLRVPRHVLVTPGGAVPSLDDLPGDRVVVKALAPGVAHKTERGAVRVAARAAEAVEGAIAAMSPGLADEAVTGWLVAEYVAHPNGPGSELLVGMRRTAEFGPVVVLGVGGIYTELMADTLPPAVVRAAGDRADPSRALRLSPAVDVLSSGVRGAAPAATRDQLAALLARLAAGAAELPTEVVEFEANPVVFADGRPVALDALARLGESPATASPRPMGQIDRLLHPRSMAIVGVSERRNPGRVILENVLAAGFPAERITVVRSGVDEIAGCRCVPDLESLASRVDLLVLSIAASAAPVALEEVVRRGAAEAVILIPGGLGERAGSEALAARVSAAVMEGRRRGDGPVVNGGNSMGIRSVPGGYDATFIPGYKGSSSSDAAACPLAVVSQSGAFAIARLDRFPHLRPRYLVTLGNQLDLTAGDYLALWEKDPAVEVCAVYLEGFRPGDGSRFLEAAAGLHRRGGVVVLYLGGRTSAGAAAASSHTASLAPDHRIARALATDAGVLVAESLEEFEDLLRVAVLLRGRPITGCRLGAVSNAGFECVALADARGPFVFPPLGAATAGRIEAVLAGLRLEALVGVQNPLDLTPMTDAAGFAAAAEAVLTDPAVDVGVVGCVPLTPALATLESGAGHPEDLTAPGELAGCLADLWRRTDMAWVVVIDGGRLYDPLADYLERAGLPVFRTADRALRALGGYVAGRLGT